MDLRSLTPHSCDRSSTRSPCFLLERGPSRPKRAFGAMFDAQDQAAPITTNSLCLTNRYVPAAKRREWLDVFEGSGLPYSAVNDIQGTLNHEHVLARDMVKEMEHEWCGPIKMVNTPVKYSESKPSIRSVPPMLGQHTDEILREILGLNESEIEKLKAEGAVR